MTSKAEWLVQAIDLTRDQVKRLDHLPTDDPLRLRAERYLRELLLQQADLADQEQDPGDLP